MTTKILYCWELGMGFGHVTRMDQIANRQEFSDCKFSYALRDVNKSHVIKTCDDDNLFQAPRVNLPFKEMSANFSHLMRRCGWDTPESAIQLVSAWRNLIKSVDPDVVLLDHSPGASAAAYTLGLPCKQVGNSFEVPLITSPMQNLHPRYRKDNDYLMEQDKIIMRSFDKVSKRFGLKEQDFLSYEALYNQKNSIIAGHPILEHYGQRSSDWKYIEQVSKVAVAEQDLDLIEKSQKPKIFFYLDARTQSLMPTLKALSKQFTLFGFISGTTTSHENIANADIHVFNSPLNVDQAMSICSIVLSNGGVGLTYNSIKANKPMFFIPMHLEQSMICERLFEKKIAIVLSASMSSEKISYYGNYVYQNINKLKSRIEELKTEARTSAGLWSGNLLEDFVLK